jgi:cAMP-dependent protein kinase regulator
MIQKLNECEAFVDKIEFFKDLDIYERTKLFESLEERRLPAEKYIIKEGEMGNCFYIVAEGQLVAYKAKDGQNRMVYAYKKGDYFGEIALFKNVPRQASIKTLTEVRLFSINRDVFMQIIGPL